MSNKDSVLQISGICFLIADGCHLIVEVKHIERQKLLQTFPLAEVTSRDFKIHCLVFVCLFVFLSLSFFSLSSFGSQAIKD